MDMKLAVAACIVTALALNGKPVFTQAALMSPGQASRIGMSEVILSYFSVLIDQRYGGCVPGTVSYPLSTSTNTTANRSRTDWFAPPLGAQDRYGNEHHAPDSFFDVFAELPVASVNVNIHNAGGNLVTQVRGDNQKTNWNNQTYMGGGFDPTFAIMSLSIGGFFATPGRESSRTTGTSTSSRTSSSRTADCPAASLSKTSTTRGSR